MSTPVKFKLKIKKILDSVPALDTLIPNDMYSSEDPNITNLRATLSTSEPTGIKRNISTVYENLTTIDEIVAKIVEFFSNEKCDHFKFNGSSLTYEEDQGITIDEDDIKERLKAYMETMERYGRTSWSCQFDAQGYTDVEWTTDAVYIAQLIITEPKE